MKQAITEFYSEKYFYLRLRISNLLLKSKTINIRKYSIKKTLFVVPYIQRNIILKKFFNESFLNVPNYIVLVLDN